jgi:hypothetical protein
MLSSSVHSASGLPGGGRFSSRPISLLIGPLLSQLDQGLTVRNQLFGTGTPEQGFMPMELLQEDFHKRMQKCAVEILQGAAGVDEMPVDQLRRADSATRSYNIEV